MDRRNGTSSSAVQMSAAITAYAHSIIVHLHWPFCLLFLFVLAGSDRFAQASRRR